jgi:hypothetical protein
LVQFFCFLGPSQTAHYDHGRNFIAMVKGHKRYVISPPRSCDSLELLGHGLPSARHASFDWADPSELSKRAGKPFCATTATEVVLAEGQVGASITLMAPHLPFEFLLSLPVALLLAVHPLHPLLDILTLAPSLSVQRFSTCQVFGSITSCLWTALLSATQDMGTPTKEHLKLTAA